MFFLNSTFVAHKPNDSHSFTFSRYRNSVCSANRKLHLPARGIANLLRHFGGRRCDEAWRIQRKIMLTSSFGKIASLRSRDGAILYEEIDNSNLCRIFLEKDEPSNECVTRAFYKSEWEEEESKRAFPWSGSTFASSCFSTKDCEKQQRTLSNFFFIKSEKNGRAYVPVYSLNSIRLNRLTLQI